MPIIILCAEKKTFGLARHDVQQPTSSAGIRPQIRPVPVAHLSRLCHISWTIVQIWNFPAVCLRPTL